MSLFKSLQIALRQIPDVVRAALGLKQKTYKLLEKTNCIFLTTIKTRSEDTRESTKYITEFNSKQ